MKHLLTALSFPEIQAGHPSYDKKTQADRPNSAQSEQQVEQLYTLIS